MSPPGRELELTEGAVTALLSVAALALGLATYGGFRLARSESWQLQRPAQGGRETATASFEKWRLDELPPGFIGPPPPPNPAPLDGMAGAEGSDRPSVVVVSNSTDPKELRALILAEGFPAYIVDTPAGARVRVGDYATVEEATRARRLLEQRHYQVEPSW